MSPRVLLALLAAAVFVAMPAALARAAGSVSYAASVSGKQDLTWKVDGTSGNCEIRRGTGNGTVGFSFKSPKPATAAASSSRQGLSFTSSIPSVAQGSISGNFTDAVETPCPGFTPGDPVTAPTGGCGATRFGVRVDIQARKAFLYVTGPNTPLGPVSLAQASGECPFPIGGPIDSSSDRSSCGDGRQLWQRSWGVSYSGGAGLFASRVHMTPKQLFRSKRKVTITGRKDVSCTIESQYSGGVKLTGSLKYTISLKRI
jgi:hypothetical protein